ncbi:MAG: thiolase family protein [Xanthobacteraceae bacterium]|nr:thiolase family protein [Xanthobacteraceae bacterium]
MTNIYVVGVGMTPFGKFMDKSIRTLAHQAVADAMKDAGAVVSDVGAAFYANTVQGAMEGQLMVGGQVVLRSMGFETIPITNVENACASGSTAFHLAHTYLRAGIVDVALAVGVEKMYYEDRAKVNSLFDGAWDVENADKIVADLQAIGKGVEPPPGRAEPPGTRSVFMDVYASLAKAHMRRFGTTERHLAAVAAKNHHHSVTNERAQYRKDMSLDEVLAARMISWPLTLPMCAPISDGASAVILCTEEALPRFKSARPIKVLASVLASGSERDGAAFERHLCRTAALKAYDQAGVGPDEMDVAEVHDASAFAEIIQTENLGFCELGQGGWLAERGETTIGGRIPVNPSGGLESKGHPVGASGLGQLFELVSQLRGEAGSRQVEGARHAIAENGGGFYGYEEAAATITILAN